MEKKVYGSGKVWKLREIFLLHCGDPVTASGRKKEGRKSRNCVVLIIFNGCLCDSEFVNIVRCYAC